MSSTLIEYLQVSKPTGDWGLALFHLSKHGDSLQLRESYGFIADDDSFKFLPYQLWMVVYWTTMVVTGDGEPGFGSGEGAWEMATTSKEGSRDENWPLSKARVSDDT